MTDTANCRNKPPNIILCVFDCLRFDSLDQLTVTEELDYQRTTFNNAYSTSSWTAPTHASLFTGELPSEHGTTIHTPRLSSDSPTLADRLSSEGYETAGFSANPWISRQFGFDTGFEHFEYIGRPLIFEDAGDPRKRSWSERENQTVDRLKKELQWTLEGNPLKRLLNRMYVHFFQQYPLASGGRVNESITNWLSQVEEPFFLFANYMDIHEPYQVQNENHSEEISEFDWYYESLGESASSAVADIMKEAYRSAVDDLNESIAELTGQLKEEGLLDNTILVFMSDHGQALGERNYWGHGIYLIEELVKVPLTVVYKDRLFSEQTVDKPVSVADLPDFLLDAAKTSGECDSGTLDSDYLLSSDNDIPIHSQTYGLPREYHSQVPDTEASLEGYEIVYYGGWRGEYDRSDGSLAVTEWRENPDVDRADAEHTIETELQTDSQHIEADRRKERDAIVKSRLEQLGYK